MARKRCKCNGGTATYSCCRSTGRSNKARTKSSSNKNKRRRDGGRDGDPISVILDRLERRGKRYAYGSVIVGGLYGAALVAEASGFGVEDMAAYGEQGIRKYPKPIRGKVARRLARRKVVGRVAYTAGKITRKVVMRGIPVIGTALLVYDLYSVADWAFAKGRLPYGAKDRR